MVNTKFLKYHRVILKINEKVDEKYKKTIDDLLDGISKIYHPEIIFEMEYRWKGELETSKHENLFVRRIYESKVCVFNKHHPYYRIRADELKQFHLENVPELICPSISAFYSAINGEKIHSLVVDEISRWVLNHDDLDLTKTDCIENDEDLEPIRKLEFRMKFMSYRQEVLNFLVLLAEF